MDSLSLETLQRFKKTFLNSQSNVLIFITKSELIEDEITLFNFIKKNVERFGVNVAGYNMRVDATIQTNFKIKPSAITEILVRNWKIVDAVGPWLLRDECSGKNCFLNVLT